MEEARVGGAKTRNKGEGCDCYFDTTQIQKGNWKEDPKVCLQNCRTEFLKQIYPGWDMNSRWLEGCRSLLSDNGTASPPLPESRFWNLYWCDSTFCGVAIDPQGGLGLDREYYQKVEASEERERERERRGGQRKWFDVSRTKTFVHSEYRHYYQYLSEVSILTNVPNYDLWKRRLCC